MNVKIGKCDVNLCSASAFMGHEELVLPMLVLDSSKYGSPDRLGAFWHCMNEQFQPNDLSGTAVMGYTAGCSGNLHTRLSLERMFVGRYWEKIPDIINALDALGSAYAFFMETSPIPLHDGFIHRCRFIARDKLADFHPQLDVAKETAQTITARDVLAAFLKAARSGAGGNYGDYWNSRAFRRTFGDDEQFDVGQAIWLEQSGVVRAWTRVVYVPK